MDAISCGRLTPRRLRYRFYNLRVAGAAAEISRKAFPDFFQCGIRVSVQQMHGCENHSGRTDAALRAATLQEGLLQDVQRIPCRDSLDGNDVRAFSLKNRYETAVHEHAVNQHGA